ELHGQHVADLSVKLAERLGAPAACVLRCRLGGWLHDVGKLAIPDRILAKRGPLDEAEWHTMRQHAVGGAQLVLRVAGLAEASAVVRHHHERYDGTGYPDGLAGAEIPLDARIVSVVDAFCAMTAQRVYSPGRSREDALAELHRCSGTQFDPV